MTLVIDASVAVKWVLDEPRSEAALALKSEQLTAPVLWLAETANALWRHVRLGELTVDEVLIRMSELQSGPVALFPIEPHVATALGLASRSNHPVYDCFYLALAIHQGTQVVTDDRRFAAAAARVNLDGRVRLLGG
jgi:predicted nucleic acid-binding protein